MKKSMAFFGIGLLIYSVALIAAPGFFMRDFNSTDWIFDRVLDDFVTGPCPDIVAVGSSHAYRSFDPRIAEGEGLLLSNLASPLQTPLNSYYLLKEALRRREEVDACIPRVIALELYEKTLRDSGLESFTKTLNNRPLGLNVLFHAVAMHDPVAVHMFFARTWERALGTGSNSAEFRPFEKYVRGGFISTVTERKRPAGGGPVESKTAQREAAACVRDPESCAPSKNQLRYLERTVDLIVSAGAMPVLVVAPMPSDFEAVSPHLGPANAAIRSLAEKKGVSLISDFSKARLDDYSDFSDGTHLNNTGAEKVTGEFIRQLLLIPGYGSAPESSS